MAEENKDEELSAKLTVENRLTKVEDITISLHDDVEQLKADYKLMKQMQQDLNSQGKTLKAQGEALAAISKTLKIMSDEMIQDKIERLTKEKEAAEASLKEKQENKQYWTRLCIGCLITTVLTIIAFVIESIWA